MDVVWSPLALSDVENIRYHIATFNPDAANRLVRELIELGNSLELFPYRGRRIAPGLHEVVAVYPYIVRYLIGVDRVEIVQVRHGNRALA